jgi:hypothetical protein
MYIYIHVHDAADPADADPADHADRT